MHSRSYEPGLKCACTRSSSGKCWNCTLVLLWICVPWWPLLQGCRLWGLPASSSCFFWHLSEQDAPCCKENSKSTHLLLQCIRPWKGAQSGGVCVCCCPCSDVLWGVACWPVCSALQRCGVASGAVAGACELCARAGRSSGAPCQQHCPKAAWQQSRQAGHGSGSAPGPPEPPLVLASGLMASEVCQSGTAKAVSCASWPCDRAWRALGKQPAAEAGPVLLTHHSHCHRDWLFLKNMPNPSERLKMSALRGNVWVCQICWLFISRAFNYISQLVNFEWIFAVTAGFFPWVFLPLEWCRRF